MKKRILIYCLSVITALGLVSCDINDWDDDDRYYDDDPPAAPTGLVVYNGDGRVDIVWNYNRENDVAGYNVFYAYSYNGKYTLLGSTEDNYFIDYGAENGVRYYYAVEAYDYNGNISELSYEEVYSTPRPEGYNQAIYDYLDFPNKGAYSFTTFTAVPVDDNNADFLYDRDFEGQPYLFVLDDSDIRDMGRTNNIYDIEYAPSGGWSSTKDAVAIPGHTYVIWTWDNHYAKVRVKEISGERIVFDWAFQLVEGEKQLKPSPVPAERSPQQITRKSTREAAN
jgi:hypothetical protein